MKFDKKLIIPIVIGGIIILLIIGGLVWVLIKLNKMNNIPHNVFIPDTNVDNSSLQSSYKCSIIGTDSHTCKTITLIFSSTTNLDPHIYTNDYWNKIFIPNSTIFTCTPTNPCIVINNTSASYITGTNNYNKYTLSLLGNNTSNGNGVVINNINTSIWQNLVSIEDDSNSIIQINSGVFENCKNLQSVILPGVTSILASAFQGCTALTTITIVPITINSRIPIIKPTSVNTLAFQGCSELVNFNIPNITKLIGNNIFDGCSKLTILTFTNLFTISGSACFANCTNLTEIHLPNTTNLNTAQSCFYNCSNLKIFDAPNLTQIGSDIFYKSGLVNINLPKLKIAAPSAFTGLNNVNLTLPLLQSAGMFCFTDTTMEDNNVLLLPSLKTADIGCFYKSPSITFTSNFIYDKNPCAFEYGMIDSTTYIVNSTFTAKYTGGTWTNSDNNELHIECCKVHCNNSIATASAATCSGSTLLYNISTSASNALSCVCPTAENPGAISSIVHFFDTPPPRNTTAPKPSILNGATCAIITTSSAE